MHWVSKHPLWSRNNLHFTEHNPTILSLLLAHFLTSVDGFCANPAILKQKMCNLMSDGLKLDWKDSTLRMIPFSWQVYNELRMIRKKLREVVCFLYEMFRCIAWYFAPVWMLYNCLSSPFRIFLSFCHCLTIVTGRWCQKFISVSAT